jgi:hypothetical protein
MGMSERRHHGDLRDAVVVPVSPGPVVHVRNLERGRDDIDELLDEVFGEPDGRGPGATDAVLVAGGLGAIVAGQVASLSSLVTLVGVAAVGLGAVLPVQALWRRGAAARRFHRLQSMLGDGMLLRTDHSAIEQFLAVHGRLLVAAEPLAPAPKRQVCNVAHGALLEVASLLGGRALIAQEELSYVVARRQALADLTATLSDPRVGDGDKDGRRAMVEARHEVEQLTGRSSLTEASDLARKLLGQHDS